MSENVITTTETKELGDPENTSPARCRSCSWKIRRGGPIRGLGSMERSTRSDSSRESKKRFPLQLVIRR